MIFRRPNRETTELPSRLRRASTARQHTEDASAAWLGLQVILRKRAQPSEFGASYCRGGHICRLGYSIDSFTAALPFSERRCAYQHCFAHHLRLRALTHQF